MLPHDSLVVLVVTAMIVVVKSAGGGRRSRRTLTHGGGGSEGGCGIRSPSIRLGHVFAGGGKHRRVEGPQFPRTRRMVGEAWSRGLPTVLRQRGRLHFTYSTHEDEMIVRRTRVIVRGQPGCGDAPCGWQTMTLYVGRWNLWCVVLIACFNHAEGRREVRYCGGEPLYFHSA